MTIFCPFCGSTGFGMCVDQEVKPDGRKFYFVSCDHCEATGPTEYDRGDALRRWEHRATEADDGD